MALNDPSDGLPLSSRTPRLKAVNVSAAYGRKTVVTNASLSLHAGEFVGLIGPNGAGKSTLLRVLSRTLAPKSGMVRLYGDDIAPLKARDVARAIGFVPQNEPALFDFTVREVVLMGRHPHVSGLSGETEQDFDIVNQAMASADITSLADRLVTSLSGGEHQRVLLARAIAQQAPIFLLDEPTAHLDLTHQADILSLARTLSKEHGTAVLAALHDLHLAAEFCDRLILISNGSLLADGPPETVLTEQLLEQAYGGSIQVVRNPSSGKPFVQIVPASPDSLSTEGTAGGSEASRKARAVYMAALNAVRADTLVRRALRVEGETATFGTEQVPLGGIDRIFVVGAGKAAAAMAAAVEEQLGSRLKAGVVVTKEGHSGPTRLIRVLEASHPVPDERSVAAGRAIVEMASQAGERDLVLCLLSGGASAVMELPREGITLKDLRETTNLLLRSGTPIEELNAVRACLSDVKAGGLARAAAPARLICLVLSDVLGNPLDVIGSGPALETDPDPSRALRILVRYGLMERIPPSVATLLNRQSELPEPKSPGAGRPGRVQHVIIGDIWTAIEAAREEALRQGLHPSVLTGWMQGEAREAGRFFGGVARDIGVQKQHSGIDCYIGGGETTVTVTGRGKGGRSQEIAAAAVPLIAGVEKVALLAAGTDGTDGPTDAGGALVDGETVARIQASGGDVEKALSDNDCYPLLEAADALIITGPTNSNVGDLVIIVSA